MEFRNSGMAHTVNNGLFLSGHDLCSIIGILLVYSALAVGSQFPCHPGTSVTGSMFYQTFPADDYAKALKQCKILGADLPSFATAEDMAEFSRNRWNSWLSAKMQKWIHLDYPVALTLDIWAAGEPSYLGPNSCASIERSATNEYELISGPCSSHKKAVVCVTDDIRQCANDGIMKNKLCYITPSDTLAKTRAEALSDCAANGAKLLFIKDEEHFNWVVNTYVGPLWTGYIYHASATDFYWSSGLLANITNWSPGYPQGNSECVLQLSTNETFNANCSSTSPYTCVLEAPYASQCQTIQNGTDGECICVWAHDGTTATYTEAMNKCIEDGGTLLLYNSAEMYTDLVTLNPSPLTIPKWIGISDGFSNGVFRGTDGSAITWSNWKPDDTEPKGNAGYSCVYLKEDGDMYTDRCTTTREFICQGPPDEQYHQCSKTSGCIRSLDAWEIFDYDQMSYTGSAISNLNDIDRFNDCWNHCIMNIEYACLAVVYDGTTKRCRQYSDLSGSLNPDENSHSRQRAWKNYTAEGYCSSAAVQSVFNYDGGVLRCEEINTGWHLPIIRDQSMVTHFNSISSFTEFWLDAQDELVLPRVYRYSDNTYPYFTTFKNGDPKMSTNEAVHRCLIQKSGGLWDVKDCTVNKNVLCMRFKGDMCRAHAPDIENGYKVINEYTGVATYHCNPNYHFPTSGASSMSLQCTCYGVDTTGLENCTASECVGEPELVDSIVTYRQGNAIGDVLEITCLSGFRIVNTTSAKINSTCVLESGASTASWCWVPPCERIQCLSPPDVAHAVVTTYSMLPGSVATCRCIYGYTINDTVLEANATCEQSVYDLGATWTAVPLCTDIFCGPFPTIQQGDYYTIRMDYIGSYALYRCKDGYVVNGSEPVTTTANVSCILNPNMLTAKWNYYRDCIAIQCPSAPPVNNATVNALRLLPDDVATYTCDRGFLMTNNSVREANATCVLDLISVLKATWTNIPQCTAVLCPSPPDVDNTTVSTHGFLPGDVATYTCDSGFLVKNIALEANAICVLDQLQGLSAAWTDIPLCAEIVPTTTRAETTTITTAIRDVTTSYIISTIVTTDYVTTTTYAGRTTTAATTMVITTVPAILTPSRKDPTTEPTDPPVQLPTVDPSIRQCPAPNGIANGQSVHTGLGEGDVATYTSSSGFDFVEGGKTRTSVCMTNKQWSVKVLSPQVKHCPVLPHKGGTITNSNKTNEGTRVRISCTDAKAKMTNGLSFVDIICISLKKWSLMPSDCDERCGPFPLIPHSNMIAYNNSVSGAAVIRCDASYRFIDGQKEKLYACLNDTAWEEPDYCYLKTCPSLKTPLNGRLSTDIALEGTIVTVSCDVGYWFSYSIIAKQFNCGTSLQWNDMISDCIRVICPLAQNISHGIMLGDVTATAYNTTLIYRCDEGYRLEYGHTELTSRCEELGEWTYPVLSCDVGRCSPVPAIPLATGSTDLALNGTVSVYGCQPGYVFDTYQAKLYVGCNGTSWNLTDTKCTRIECPEITTLLHATFSGTGYHYGDVIDFTCHEGYLYNNNLTHSMYCLQTGDWSPNTTGCQPIDCGPPPVVLYSRRVVTGDSYYGQSLMYTCLNNYWISRHVFKWNTTCTMYGWWSGQVPVCKVITCSAIPVWVGDLESNTTSRIVGTVANISCTRDIDGQKQYMLTACSKTGDWEPPVDACEVFKPVYVPDLSEAHRARVIGFAVIGIIIMIGCIFAISDVPVVISHIKGSHRNAPRNRHLKRNNLHELRKRST